MSSVIQCRQMSGISKRFTTADIGHFPFASRLDGDAKILADDERSLLADRKSGGASVCPDVGRNDRQVWVLYQTVALVFWKAKAYRLA